MDIIKEVSGTNLRELALFAGYGGGILGGSILGWKTVCGVEIEPYAAAVLCQRQNEGFLNPFPIWDDVRTFDGRPWAGRVDVISGGSPCTNISAAGKGDGIECGESALWFEMLRIIGEVRPKYVFLENSPMLRTRGLGHVLSGLSKEGYNASWDVISAGQLGAPHERERMWVLGKKTE